MKYGDKIIRMEGNIVEVHDGGVVIDLKGRLGCLKIPKRMIISDYDLEVGQTVAWNMSFIEQESPDVDPQYVRNLNITKERRKEALEKFNKK